MKRLLICGACVASMAIVAIAVMLACGIELVQREKQRSWREEAS
jgi:hypothetical protein